MYEELTAGQCLDWEQFHRQFRIDFNRDDLHWGIMIADFRNANRAEGASEVTPADVMPYYDQYGDDDAFIQAMQGIAASIKAEAGAAEEKRKG